MNTIIQEFIKEINKNMVESLKNLENDFMFSDFTDDLMGSLMKLGSKIATEFIKTLENDIYLSKERKSKYISYQKDSKANERKLITMFGEIEFSRRYYENKSTNEKVYLLDKILGLDNGDRMVKNVEEKLLEIANVKSYEYAGKNTVYNTEISKETVKNKIEELKIVDINKTYEEKKVISTIFIQADEDHVSLQEGGTFMPRIIKVFEENINGKHIGVRYFGGEYDGKNDTLWEEVYTYLTEKYDYYKLDNIYIMGDGANWIKSGLNEIPKSKYIMDKFHLEKAIVKMTKNNKEYINKIKEEICAFNFEKVKELEYELIAEEMNQNKRNYMNDTLEYILNNEEGIRNIYKYDNNGCSAEGMVSHVLSARLSSRPMGWNKSNAGKIAKLRIMSANNENIKLITRNKENIKEEVQVKQKEVIKMIKNKNIIRNDGLIYSIPDMIYGDFEFKEQIKEILANKVI